MARNNKTLTKRIIAALCSCSMALTMLSGVPFPKVQASQNDGYLSGESLVPLAQCLHPMDVMEWTPEGDPDALYSRAGIALQDRFQSHKTNPNADERTKIMALSIMNKMCSYGPSQGLAKFDTYAFNYWQYVDQLCYWGGSSSEGIIVNPTAEVIDASHKNGVPVTGTVFFPPAAYDGKFQWVNEFLTQNPDGTFPIADKMNAMANYYGFDGWFINTETGGGNSATAQKLQQWMKYYQSIKSDNQILQMYDSMTTGGYISWQGALNGNNDMFFHDKNTDERVSDAFFVDFRWGSNSLTTSGSHAQNLGRDPYTVFAGFDVQASGPNSWFSESFLNADGSPKVSIGLYCPDATFHNAGNMAKFFQDETKFWVGADGNPTETESGASWKGMSNYVVENSPVNDIPFVTNFNTGNGELFAVNGEISRKLPWYNRGLADVLPTWRWDVDSEGSPLKAELDYTDAYYGGSSAKFSGRLEAAHPNTVHLYKTALELTATTQISVTYKAKEGGDNLKLALSFDDTNSDYDYLDVPDAPAGQWNTATFALADYAGRTLQGINLYFESEADVADFTINIGEIAVTDSAADTQVAPPTNANIQESMMNSKGQPEFRMTWDKSADADVYQYEVYKVNADGTREFLGATANNALFVQDFSRDSDAPTSVVEVVAMDHAYNRSTAAETLFIWGTSSGEEVERNNIALRKPVVASRQISSAESAEKAVDGQIKGNSKWCVGSPGNGNWIRVDLGETKTIRQYRLINAGHPDAGEASSMNTRDWRLEVSDDDETYTVVSTVRGNADNAPDIILDTPASARYVRLTVDAAEQAGQGAIRLYEFEIYDEVYTVPSKAIAPKNVTVTNGPGSEDSVVVTGLGEGDVVQLFDTIEEGAAPLAVSEPVQSGETSVTISDVQLAKKGGILYFGRVSPNKSLSPLNAKVYAAEENQGPEIHGVPETGASRTAVTLTTDEEVLFKVNGVLADRYATSIKISLEGAYTVTATGKDGEESIEYVFAIDRTKPVLTATVANGAATRDDVTITANEDVLFTVNDVTDTKYSTSKTFTQDGTYVVKITDRAGNYGGGIRFTIQKGKPVLEGVPENGFTSGRVTLTANERVLYYINGELASEVFNYRISFVNEGSYEVKAVNGLGSETTVQFTIDRTKPTMTASVEYGQTTSQDVLITASEDVLFSVNDVDADGYQSELTLSEEGAYVVKIWDRAGNYGGGIRFAIDKTGPALRAVVEGTNTPVENGGFINKTVSILADEKAFFTINGEEAGGAANFAKIKAEGTYEIIAKDLYGNASEPFIVTIDKTKPVLSSAQVENGGSSRVEVELTANEDVLFTVNGVAADRYETAARFAEEGSYTVVAADKAGNKSAAYTFTIADMLKLALYPVPQEITYLSGDEAALSKDVNIVAHGEQKAATLAKLEQVLRDNGYTPSVSDSAAEGKTNLLLTADADHCADCQALPSNVTEKEGYTLVLKQGAGAYGDVSITGADADGVYNGVMTLAQVLTDNAGEDGYLQAEITDYPEIGYRGVIEGYYGYPWDTTDRSDIIRSTSDYKMNTYVYAPKDDVYHRAQWRELYPEDKANELRQLVQAANESNVSFVWTLHPGDSISLTSDADFEAALLKLEQLYDLGVRQFGVLFDDVTRNQNAANQANFINRVDDEFVKAKGDVKPLITVGTYYCQAWGLGPSYLRTLRNTLHDDVEIMWTGGATMSNISREIFEWPKTAIGSDRDFAVWWNFPTNDYCDGNLHMAPMKNLNPNLDNVSAFFANPMAQAQASKVALFSLADYTWNTDAYDYQMSWETAIARLVPEVSAEFQRFADNISYLKDSSGVYGDFLFEESNYLIEQIQALRTAFETGEGIAAQATAMKAEFETMITDADTIRTVCTNAHLLDEIDPWLGSYRVLAQAGAAAMDAVLCAASEDIEGWLSQTALVNQKFEEMKDFIYVSLETSGTKENIVQVGTQRLKPVIGEALTASGNLLSASLQTVLDPAFIGTIENLPAVDVAFDTGKYSVSGLEGLAIEAGRYVGIALPRATKVGAILIAADALDQVAVEYSLNGIGWTAAEGTLADGMFSFTTPVDATFIRIFNNGEAAVSMNLERFEIQPVYKATPTVSTSMGRYENYYAENAVDGSMNTKFWSNAPCAAGDHFTVDLGNVMPVFDIATTFGSADYIKKGEYQISENGINWTSLGALSYNTASNPVAAANANGAMARYIRIAATGSNDGNWVQIVEIEFNKTIPGGGDTYVPLITGTPAGSFAALYDGDLSTAYAPGSVADGDALLYKMSRITDVSSIAFVQDAGSICGATVSVLDTEGNWKEIGTLDRVYTSLAVGKTITEVRIAFDAEMPLPNLYEIIVK